jgi:uncharacterized protein with PQ loop repeat
MKTLFGVLGMVLVQGSTIFQIIKFYKTKKIDGVSVGFWWTIFIGLSCYLVYALCIMDTIYIISNTIGIFLTSISLSLYYYYKKGQRF